MDSLIGVFVNEARKRAAIPYRNLDFLIAKKFDQRDEKAQ